MNLSSTLFANLTRKLRLDAYSLTKERSHIQNLFDQIEYLKKLKKKQLQAFKCKRI